jgi:hypothetical protein
VEPHWIVEIIRSHWNEIAGFFNSVFFTAIAGSFAGAGAGAWIAQRIAERKKERDELILEMRNTNAASTVSFAICNSLIGFKKQFVKSLYDSFNNEKTAFQIQLQRRRNGEINKDVIYPFSCNLQTFFLPRLPLEILQKISFERLSLGTRPLHLVMTLGQTAEGLNSSIEIRNQLIDSFKLSNASSKSDFPAIYFGFTNGDKTDARYSSTIDAIYRQTDDGIFFSQLLCKDLNEHGEQIAAAFKKKYGSGAPNINKLDLTKALLDGLLPTDENYADWIAMFERKPKPISWVSRAQSILKLPVFRFKI